MKPNEIVAARGLLKWSQSDLAQASGISSRSISQIELEKQNASQETLVALEMAFDRAGISFRNNGVFFLDRQITILEGANRFIQLFDDIGFSTQNGEELLIDGADESKTPPILIEKVASMRKAGLRMRHLIQDGDRFIRGKISEYRWLPAESFVNQPVFIYGNNVALSSETEPKIFIHRDQNLANFHRSRFELLWKILKQPDKSEIKDVFDV